MTIKETTSMAAEPDMDRLKEMVLDHLGIPRPGTSKHIQELQDHLLPSFMQTARHAWLLAAPLSLPNEPSYHYFQNALAQVHPGEIRTLNTTLETLGVHDLLRDISNSPDVAMLGSLPIDPYEERLLRTAGHPKPRAAVMEYLRLASKEPGFLASPSKKLEEAAKITIEVHGDINLLWTQQSAQPPPQAAPNPQATVSPTPEKPKRRKLFSGVAQLFSGLVLLTGNAIVIPTVTIGGVMALPILASLAGGIVAVGEGIAQLRREGE